MWKKYLICENYRVLIAQWTLYLKIPRTISFLMTWPIKHRNESVFHIGNHFNLSHLLVFSDSSFCDMSMFLQFIHSLVDLFLQTLGFNMTRLVNHQDSSPVLCSSEVTSMFARESEMQKERESVQRRRHEKRGGNIMRKIYQPDVKS